MTVSEIRYSKSGTSPYRIVRFLGEDREIYETYLTFGMRNIENWEDVIDIPYGLFSNLDIKKNNIIDADSRPKFEGQLTAEQAHNFKVYGTLERPVYIPRRRESDDGSTFNDLFE